MTDQPEDTEHEKRETATKPVPVQAQTAPPTEAIILKSSD